MIKDYYWLITTISLIIGIFLFTVLVHAGGKVYQPKDSKYGTKKITLFSKRYKEVRLKRKNTQLVD